jgi:hypothetical protein
MWWSSKSRPSAGNDGSGHSVAEQNSELMPQGGTPIDRHMEHPVAHIQTVLTDFVRLSTSAAEPFHPHCGTPKPSGDNPHCGASFPDNGGSPRGKPDLARAASALDALASTWDRPVSGPSARELAIAFRCALQACPELVGVRLAEFWIKRYYPRFCWHLRVELLRPAYKDFLCELANEMPRKRHDLRPKGRRRETYTSYLVRDPNETVVALSERMRA